MSADEVLLLSHTVIISRCVSSDDFILVVKEKESVLNNYGCITYLVPTATQVLRHVIPPNAVIGFNTFASWIFSTTFESLQLLHAGMHSALRPCRCASLAGLIALLSDRCIGFCFSLQPCMLHIAPCIAVVIGVFEDGTPFVKLWICCTESRTTKSTTNLRLIESCTSTQRIHNKSRTNRTSAVPS